MYETIILQTTFTATKKGSAEMEKPAKEDLINKIIALTGTMLKTGDIGMTGKRSVEHEDAVVCNACRKRSDVFITGRVSSQPGYLLSDGLHHSGCNAVILKDLIESYENLMIEDTNVSITLDEANG